MDLVLRNFKVKLKKTQEEKLCFITIYIHSLKTPCGFKASYKTDDPSGIPPMGGKQKKTQILTNIKRRKKV